jgi:AcrR family transcriptional regulator
MPSIDRRIQKTRALLVSALRSLMHEKAYDAIALKEILHRANVARSTFYTHFRDKDDLLSTAMSDLLRSSAVAPARRAEGVLRFSLPVFQHVDQHRRAPGGRPHAGGMTVSDRARLHERLEREIARTIDDEVRRGMHARASAQVSVPAELLIRYVTSTFTTVLDWWVDSDSALGPADVDAWFRALVAPALARALD